MCNVAKLNALIKKYGPRSAHFYKNINKDIHVDIITTFSKWCFRN